MEYREMFEVAEGWPPHAFQERFALNGLPDVARIPMGAGKTAAVTLGWLWRARFADAEIRRATPRRLVIALPMRTLVEQTAGTVREWLQRLGLSDDVDVHVIMGGTVADEHTWRMNAHRHSIVIGTVDCLVSKALVRGYGISRAVYPIDFALITNGSHLVIDETQLAPASTATLRQVLGFVRRYGTAEPVGLTCMSATIDDRVIDTVDNPVGQVRVEEIAQDDRRGHLGRLLAATRTVRRLQGDTADPVTIAQAAMDLHQPGSRTLVVVNTVKSAVAIRKALTKLKPAARLLLVHSRYRGVDRARLGAELAASPGVDGTIVVATQVVEAGVDIDSAVLMTEASPWPSLCQRSGRCNRYAQVDDAQLWWFSALPGGPYPAADVSEAERVLVGLEGRAVTGEDLLAQQVEPSDLALRILRRPDFLALFDTMPDLSGADIDIAPYIRDTDQLDAQVGWIDTEAVGPPPKETVLPDPQWRCPAPLGALRKLITREGVHAWTFDVAAERWERVRPSSRIRPGELVLVLASDGGYDPILGLEHASRIPVPLQPPQPSIGGTEPSDAMSDDSSNLAQPAWSSLDDHLRDARVQAVALIDALEPNLSDDLRETVVAAAVLHDVGKSHPAWQEGLRQTAPDAAPPAGILAKSPGRRRLSVAERPGFRHELVSALLIGDEAGASVRRTSGVRDERVPLVQYLAAAHHGKIRLQARDTGKAGSSAGSLLGVRNGEELPSVELLGEAAGPWRVSLDAFTLGSERSWTDAALRLLDELGPFRLAYLEALVRVADWRASAREEPVSR